MSRIAVIADIHANVPALDAVLEDIAAQDVDEVLVNGDLVGRGPQGSAIVRRVRELGLRSTRGNHEDYQLQFRRGEIPDEWRTAEEWSCARWMAAELTDDDIDYIDALPFTLASAVEPQLRLFHGSPRSHSEGLGKWTDEATLREHLASMRETVLVVAHTHRPFSVVLTTGMVVNVGSVGMPFNGDTRAQYAVLHGAGTSFDVEFRQVPYDQQPLLDVYESSGFLTAGNATSHFLRMELLAARPYLVPFLRWCEVNDLPGTMAHVDEFLGLYDPSRPMAEFLEELGLS